MCRCNKPRVVRERNTKRIQSRRTKDTQDNNETMYCFNCGQKIPKDSILCPSCGIVLLEE
ncbi:MAG: zinc ribbon domain-containing protein [Candidatus Heimdallarchaeota archaeon]